MTHKWKAGDLAMVEIARVDGAIAIIEKPGGLENYVWLDALRPFSALNPHQALRDAVVEAAMKWESKELNAAFDLQTKVKVLRAAMQPPNYEAELHAAYCAVLAAFAKKRTKPGVLEERDIAMKEWHQALQNMFGKTNDA